jgi:hypothetical protein
MNLRGMDVAESSSYEYGGSIWQWITSVIQLPEEFQSNLTLKRKFGSGCRATSLMGIENVARSCVGMFYKRFLVFRKTGKGTYLNIPDNQGIVVDGPPLNRLSHSPSLEGCWLLSLWGVVR